MRDIHGGNMGLWLLIGLALVLSGCKGGGGGGAEITVLLGAIPLIRYSMIVGMGDLFQSETTWKFSQYLDEVAAAGYKKVTRFPLPFDWGPGILNTVDPLFRTKGFKFLPILSHGAHEGTIDPAQIITWIEKAAPQLRDLVVGVQIANEQ